MPLMVTIQLWSLAMIQVSYGKLVTYMSDGTSLKNVRQKLSPNKTTKESIQY